METLSNGFTLQIAPGCFPLSTDSMVLAHFAGNPGKKRVLDLGSGCGTLGLMLCAKSPCHVTGLELSEKAHSAAQRNIAMNGLDGRMESICTDLRRISEIMPPGQFDMAVSNPPYFSGGPAAALKDARREDCCTLSDLMHAAAWTLKYGGDFYLVHRPERLGEIIARASENSLEAKRLCLLRHRADGPVNLVLLQLRKGGKPGLIFEEAALHDAAGAKTALWNEIYHIREE